MKKSLWQAMKKSLWHVILSAAKNLREPPARANQQQILRRAQNDTFEPVFYGKQSADFLLFRNIFNGTMFLGIHGQIVASGGDS